MSTDSTQPSDDLSGETIGNYILVSMIGNGSFACVYLGQDIRYPSRSVAIKIFSSLLIDQRILNEGQIVLRLDHENIVRVFEFDVERRNPKLVNRPFIVMKRGGKNLLELYPRGSIVPLERVVSYVQQLAKALDYAHNQGVIHRDVKPENILQVQEDPKNPDSEGKIQLGDFGIALRPEYDSKDDALGTPAYKAPEQREHKTCNASDQYSLAIVVYEWLYGKRPFEGDFFQLAVQHKQKLPPFEEDRGRNPVVPVAVEKVLIRALAKKPEERYPKVQDFAEALTEAAKETVVSPKPVRLKRMTFRIPRRDMIAVLVAALTALAVLAAEKEAEQISQSGRQVATSGLASTAHKTRLVYDKHKSKVSAVAWSPDGMRIASGGFDGEIQVWNLSSKTLVQYNHHNTKVLSIAWDPTSTYIVSVSADGELRFWDASTGKDRYEYLDNSIVTAATWSANRDLVVSLGTKVRVFDTPIDHGFGLPDDFFSGHQGNVNALSFSPDSTRVASASDDKTVRHWNENDGSLPSTYRMHTAQVLSVDWSSQLDLIASGGADKTVQIWVASQTKLYHSYMHNGSVLAVQWSPNGEYLVSGGSDAIAKLWKIGGGSISDYTEHSDSINGVAFSHDSRFVASASDDGTVRVWEV